MIKSLVAVVLAGAVVIVSPGGSKRLKGDGFTIDYPSTWELDQTGQMGTTFLLLSELENDKDGFRENINLVTADLKGSGIDLDSFTVISEQQIPRTMENTTLLETKRVKAQGNEHHKIIFTATQGQMDLKFQQYYWVNKEKAYILTFTSEKNKFDKYLNEAGKIMNSFKLSR